MNYSILLPSGARLTMLPPGNSEGLETHHECYRVFHRGPHSPRGGKERETGNKRAKKVKPFELPSGELFTLKA